MYAQSNLDLFLHWVPSVLDNLLYNKGDEDNQCKLKLQVGKGGAKYI